jgi:hypothetical protein
MKPGRHIKGPLPPDYKFANHSRFVPAFWGAIGVAAGTAVSIGFLNLLCRVFCE